MEDMIRIAIDGPAGAGKSTIAKNVAKRLNILHLDTGAMYRAVGLYAVENNIDPQDEEKVSDMLCNVDIKVRYKNGAQQTFLNGEDVSGKIRTSEISNAASAVSKWPEVRKLLVSIQKNIASKMSIVMDGRDIGTFVMPDAEYKFFLTASVDQRAKRRYLELAEKGMQTELNSVKSDIAKRDHQDTTRQFAPLKKADDAMEIDTTELDISQVLQKVYERLGI
jgi:cytidylate kinase